MKTLRIPLKNRPIPILIGDHSINSLASMIKRTHIGTDAIVVTMPKLRTRFGKPVERLLKKSCRGVFFLTVPDTEESKNAQLALRLIAKITDIDQNKKIFLVALGGGVVGDLTGFIAAIYKRGVPYAQIPTTLLAQVDSSIGGKTAVDTRRGKNLVGAFYQPRFIIIDTAFLKTLPQSQLLSGLSEIIKYGLIKDPALFDFIERNTARILKRDKWALSRIISRCVAIKSDIVGIDELDNLGRRVVLNFGHTFGHAIEAASDFGVSHGEAVAIGMVCACDLSHELGYLSSATRHRIETLIKRLGLPTHIKNIPANNILKAMTHDKKFAKKNRFVLITRIGRTKIIEGIAQEILRKVLLGRITKTAS